MKGPAPSALLRQRPWTRSLGGTVRLRHAFSSPSRPSTNPATTTCLNTAPLPQSPARRRPFLPRRLHNSAAASAGVNGTATGGSSGGGASTVSADEVAHFDALASSWWDPHGPSRLLHLMNPLRHDFIRGCLDSAAPPSSDAASDYEAAAPKQTTPNQAALRYLDVGCGGGIFAESAARLASTRSVTALDPSAEVLKVARAHARKDPALANGAGAGRLAYVNTSIEAFAASLSAREAEGRARDGEEVGQQQQQQQAGGATLGGGYDVVTLFEVVEHVANPSSFLAHCASLVRPDGGWLVLSTIARTWTSWAVTKVLAEDVLRVVPRGTHDWHKYVDADELKAWFAARNRKGGEDGNEKWGTPRVVGVVYVPGLGWREVKGGENVGNYFFGVRREG